ncbi:MAG: glycosyltransferase family 2 protein [Deltaproteobacteria bacterium]|nr:glycosyltransferase family 2 protein [Deltaproteobacteria bacterium]
MLISVIIPTRNRSQSLAALLESLNGIKLAPGIAVEFIVINNASTDNTAEMLKARAAKSSQTSLRVFEEAAPGKSRALNRALTEARGDLLMIIDDDVIVDPNCIAKHIEAHEQTDFAAIQGRVLPGKDPDGRSADPQRLREYNIPIIDHGHDRKAIRGVIGTNMSFKRGVLETIGGFDERLGPGAAGFSEDTEFSIRMRQAGFKIGYIPDAIGYHELNPNRYGRAYNRDMEFRKGLSRSLYRRDSIAFSVLPNLFANCLRWLCYRALGLTQKAYKTEGRVLKCAGYLVGKYRARANRRAGAAQ